MNRAVVIEEPGQLELRAVPRPAAGPGEVVVRVAWAGLCRSDVDLRDGQRPAPFARYPVVPGHEWSGVVAAVGAGVDSGLLDQPVVGENIRPCEACAPCARGDTPFCDVRYDETGFTLDGAWADHVVVPAALLHVLPAGSDLRSAAGIEPAACASAALHRAQLGPGLRVAVVGGGTIGLLCTQLARRSGAELTVVDPDPTKEELARRCGAREFVGPDEVQGTRRDPFDVVIEAAGARGTATLAVTLTRRGGQVVLCGLPSPDDTVVTLDVVSKGVQISTVFGASRPAWRDAVAAFRGGALDPGVLVTHELGLDGAAGALELVAGREPGVGKVLLRP